jgi:hypothetical protein
MSPVSRQPVPHRFTAAYTAQDVEALLDCFTPDARYHDLYFGLRVGHLQLRGMFLAGFRRGRHEWNMTEMVGDGSIAMCEWTFTMAVAISNGPPRKLRFDGASVFALTDGRCYSYREYFDRGSTFLAAGNTPEQVARLVARHPVVAVLPAAADDTGQDRAGARADRAAT